MLNQTTEPTSRLLKISTTGLTEVEAPLNYLVTAYSHRLFKPLVAETESTTPERNVTMETTAQEMDVMPTALSNADLTVMESVLQFAEMVSKSSERKSATQLRDAPSTALTSQTMSAMRLTTSAGIYAETELLKTVKSAMVVTT